MLDWAFSVFHASVNVPSGPLRILILPASTAALRPASFQPWGRNVDAFGSPGSPLIRT
jgi:hypothetical protein